MASWIKTNKSFKHTHTRSNKSYYLVCIALKKGLKLSCLFSSAVQRFNVQWGRFKLRLFCFLFFIFYFCEYSAASHFFWNSGEYEGRHQSASVTSWRLSWALSESLTLLPWITHHIVPKMPLWKVAAGLNTHTRTDTHLRNCPPPTAVGNRSPVVALLPCIQHFGITLAQWKSFVLPHRHRMQQLLEFRSAFLRTSLCESDTSPTHTHAHKRMHTHTRCFALGSD